MTSPFNLPSPRREVADQQAIQPAPPQQSLAWKSACWLGGVLLIALATWLTGAVNQYMPSPRRTWVAIRNVTLDTRDAVIGQFRHPQPREKFRFVLSWLKDDRDGKDTESVAMAFRHLRGVDLRESARVVHAPPLRIAGSPRLRSSLANSSRGWTVTWLLWAKLRCPDSPLSCGSYHAKVRVRSV